MDEHGGRKPIWLTEYGYYADDDPSIVPMPNSGFDIPLASEQLQAAYVVRWNVIMLAGGVDKIFYHAGTCDGVEPRQPAGHLLRVRRRAPQDLRGPGRDGETVSRDVPVRRSARAGRRRSGLSIPRRRADRSGRLGSGGRSGEPVRIADDRVRILDLMGRPMGKTEFVPGPTPVYVVAEELSDEDFSRAVSSITMPGESPWLPGEAP